jgi:hypothetical protein
MRRLKIPLIYIAVTGAAVMALLSIRACGEQLPPPPPVTQASAGALRMSPDALFHVLLALAAVIVVARITTLGLRRFHQPAVIGEILAGIMLGPSLLGRVSPAASRFLFPADIVPLIGVVSQIGVIPTCSRRAAARRRPAARAASVSIAVSHASIVLPMVLGALALWLYPQFSSSDVSLPTSFALFIGVSMSVAFRCCAHPVRSWMTTTELASIAPGVCRGR